MNVAAVVLLTRGRLDAAPRLLDALSDVVSRSTLADVEAVAAGKRVVALLPEQRVVATDPTQGVGALAAVQGVVAVEPGQVVPTRLALEQEVHGAAAAEWTTGDR